MAGRKASVLSPRDADTVAWHFLWFSLVFLGLCVWYTYPAIFDFAPQSTHAWRQTDGAAIAYRYYMDGLHFFEPKILNVLESDGQTIGEFPLLYYVAALIAKLFGYHDAVLRLVNLTLLFTGLWALSRLTFHLIGDRWIALFVPFLLLTSPVLAYYGFNYLPDTAALSLVFTAGLCLYYYYQRENLQWLIAGMFLFLLAGLTKITALTGLMALLLLYLPKVYGSKSMRLAGRYKIPLATIMVLAIVLGWILWMKHYKESHHSQYFLATINPIWAYSPEVISEVLTRIWTKWLTSYFHPVILAGLTGLGIFTVLTPGKQHPIAYTLHLFILLGSIALFILWFYQFHHHDYYLIIPLILPAGTLICFFLYLKEHHPRLLKSNLSRLLLLSVLALGAWQARQEMVFRYTPGNKYMADLDPSFLKTTELQAFLRERKIQYPDKVVSLPDSSPNMTLYYLRLKGWTNFNQFPELPNENNIKWDRETITHLAKKGCKYLIISDDNWLNNPDLKEVQRYPLGVFDDSIHIFDIRYLADE